jgi:hypothetical protein
MLRFAAAASAAAAAFVPCASASEAAENATTGLTEANSSMNSWNDAGLQLQLALATADARLLPLARERHFASHLSHALDFSSYLQFLPPFLCFSLGSLPLTYARDYIVLMRQFAGVCVASCVACASASCGAHSLPLCFLSSSNRQ